MKRPLIIFSTVLCGLYVLLSSNAAGPATAGNGIRNGAPGSNGTCSACHGGGAGTTTAAIALKEKATGTAANGVYKPGMVYTVTISGNNSNLAFFGFQVTAVKGTAQAGTFSNMGPDKHIANISGLQLVEHSTSLAKTNGQYEASFDWTAPAAGTGTVTFNGIINGVNKDNNTGGDRASSIVSLNLTEQSATGIAEATYWKRLKVFPQPAVHTLHISNEGIREGDYILTVYDLNGKALWQSKYRTQNNRMLTEVPLQQLAAGTYFLNIKGESQVTRMFIKQ
jgi:hypothetical protein